MSDPVTYIGVLPIGEPTAAFLSQLLAEERARRGTRRGRRALGCYRHACWCCAGSSSDAGGPARRRQPAVQLDRVPLPARGHRRAGRRRSRTARCPVGRPGGRAHPRPARWDLDRHRPVLGRRSERRGGPVVVGQAPRPWRQRPGRHRPTDGHCGPRRCGPVASTTPPAPAPTRGLLDALEIWTDPDHAVLAECGYQAERDRLTCPFKTPAGGGLSVNQRAVTRCTRPPERSPSAATRCSRPPSRRCAGSASAPGASARDHRCRARPAPHRARPHHMINPLLGNAHCS